ncbi:MAG: hypothetical protein ACW9W3_05815 [Candidatus Nitrosopumilus sp. bin_68KS]
MKNSNQKETVIWKQKIAGILYLTVLVILLSLFFIEILTDFSTTTTTGDVSGWVSLFVSTSIGTAIAISILIYSSDQQKQTHKIIEEQKKLREKRETYVQRRLDSLYKVVLLAFEFSQKQNEKENKEILDDMEKMLNEYELINPEFLRPMDQEISSAVSTCLFVAKYQGMSKINTEMNRLHNLLKKTGITTTPIIIENNKKTTDPTENKLSLNEQTKKPPFVDSRGQIYYD